MRKLCGIENKPPPTNVFKSLKIYRTRKNIKTIQNLKQVIKNKNVDKNLIKLILTKIENLQRDTKHLRKKRNKIKRSINGNIRNTFKILQWNKGDFQLISKIEEIKTILKDRKPDVLVVNELNLNINEDQNITSIPGFNFECDNLLNVHGIARTGHVD